jgi:hypothetical protein
VGDSALKTYDVQVSPGVTARLKLSEADAKRLGVYEDEPAAKAVQQPPKHKALKAPKTKAPAPPATKAPVPPAPPAEGAE